MSSTSKLEFLFFLCFTFSSNILLQGVLSTGASCADTCSVCMNGGQCLGSQAGCTWDNTDSSCLTECTSNTDCNPANQYCSGTTCEAKKKITRQCVRLILSA
jgi:hypothetical protein